MLADEVDYVLGVDTHRDQHTLAVVVAPTGAVLAQTVIRAIGRGYAQALRFAESHAGGVRAWAIEGAGLRSVIVTAPEQLRDELRRLPVTKLIHRCSRFRRSGSRAPDE